MTKKCFISYAWSSPKHEEWVLSLAERLTRDGIEVILDKWDLKEGHDKYSFMERMVSAIDVDKVLIILDKRYAEKADDRAGGVGTETTIISQKVYESTDQEKFIPIISELDADGNPYLPIYLRSRIYIDLSSEGRFEAGYEKLLRNIYQRPSLTRPKLGTAPSYLFKETAVNFKTTLSARIIEQQLEKNPNRANAHLSDFLDEFIVNLEDFGMKDASHVILTLGEQVFHNLNQANQLKEDYISFLMTFLKFDVAFDADILIGFFEKLTSLLNYDWLNKNGIKSNENYKFIITETFLYTIAIALKLERYNLLAILINSKYFIQSRHSSSSEPVGFSEFNQQMEYFDQFYNSHHDKNYINAQADFMIRRIPEKFRKDDLLNADLFCHYLASLKGERWFPITYPYKDSHSKQFTFFNKLASKRHFEKVKGIFDVNTPDELVQKLLTTPEILKQQRGFSRAFDNIPSISNYFNTGNLASNL